MTPGQELRTTRERLRLTREQISSRTKIPVRKIAALEEDAFDELPAGIYLDGIAAAYAREVGLDGDAVVRKLRMQVAPPPPPTLQQIVATRESAVQRAPYVGLGGLTVAQSMAAFAAVAFALVIAGAGVHLFPGLLPAPRQETTVATTVAAALPDTEPAPIPKSDPQLRSERGTTGSAPVPEPVASEEAPPLTGVWTLETEIESSSMKAYEGLRLGYRLELRQDGDRIEGTGLKVAENGVALSAARRTAIIVRGTLDEGRVRLTFGEQGALRRTSGTLDLVLDQHGVLRGGFASEAARSAGAVKARRL